jgi:hypothetical protein
VPIPAKPVPHKLQDLEQWACFQWKRKTSYEYLAAIEPSNSAITLSVHTKPQHNLELLIVLGLAHMDSADFHCVKKPDSTPVENALSAACWSVMVKQNVSNVFIQNQSRAESGYVDFYCNGFINGVVAFLLNGHTLEKHINRCHEKSITTKTGLYSISQ